METKTQVTRKFMWGVGIIIFSLILGKLVLVPIFIFPTNATLRLVMILIYIFSWIIMFIGMFLAGVEGYRLATHKYKHYQKKTIHHVKSGVKKTHNHAVNHTKKAVKHTKNAIHKTKRSAKKTAKKTSKFAKKTVIKIRKPMKKSERT